MQVTREDGLVTAVAGMPRTGKTTWVQRETRDHARVLVWDYRGEYQAANCTLITNLRTLLTTLKGHKTAGRFCYQGKVEDFDTWCFAALAWGKYFPATLIADELADVTTTQKAPQALGEIERKGAGYGLHFYGISVSPSESDKTLWRCAQLYHCHTLMLQSDVELMSKKLMCRPEDLQGLRPYQYLERTNFSREFTRGGP